MQAKRDAGLARRALSQLREGRWFSNQSPAGRGGNGLQERDFSEEGLVPKHHGPLPAELGDRASRRVCLQPSTSGRSCQGTASSKHGLIDHVQRFFTAETFTKLTSGTNRVHTTICRGFASNAGAPRSVPSSGPSLQDFIQSSYRPSDHHPTLDRDTNLPQIPYLRGQSKLSGGRVYFETYGCQMNVSDMETVLAIMNQAGYDKRAERAEDADAIFVMTCAIRENAERKIWQRLGYFKNLKRNWRQDWKSRPGAYLAQRPPKVAVLGCMAERLKTKLLEADKLVDVVCGPDAYRDLPRLLAQVDRGQTGVNVMLSLDETYADITPVRICENSVSAYVSIMRGCDNMCSYCIVPFTRGRERSRPLASIVREVGELWDQGVKEVTLLGQNVNSYRDLASSAPPSEQPNSPSESTSPSHSPVSHPVPSTGPSEQPSPTRFASPELSTGFKTIYKPRTGGLTFAHLLDTLSAAFPEMRFRFTSPHPKDFPDELIALLRDRPNVCKAIHLPAQSGSSSVLERMRRGYTREAYLALVDRIRREVPDISISSDFISGFCGETEADHRDTLSLLDAVGYDMAYMFAYSVREKTHAHRRFEDDVADDVKKRRLAEVIDTFRRRAVERQKAQVGTCQLVLVEGPNKRNPETELVGTTDGNYKVIFPKQPILYGFSSDASIVKPIPGDYVAVLVTDAETATLNGRPLRRTSITEWSERQIGESGVEERVEACA